MSVLLLNAQPIKFRMFNQRNNVQQAWWVWQYYNIVYAYLTRIGGYCRTASLRTRKGSNVYCASQRVLVPTHNINCGARLNIMSFGREGRRVLYVYLRKNINMFMLYLYRYRLRIRMYYYVYYSYDSDLCSVTIYITLMRCSCKRNISLQKSPIRCTDIPFQCIIHYIGVKNSCVFRLINLYSTSGGLQIISWTELYG